jgi:hypothetical protein
MFSFFGSLPLLAKIGLVLIGLFVLGFLALWIMMVAYERTDERPFFSTTWENKRLEIRAVERRYVGGTSRGYRLYWNGQAVAYRGGVEGVGQPDGPFPIDPEDQTGLLVQTISDTLDGAGWVVWVDPDEFSRADFAAIAGCLKQHPTVQKDEESVRIAQVVYGKVENLKPRLYTFRASNHQDDQYELTVQPDGRVDLRYGYQVMTMGEVTLEQNQRILTWHYVQDITLPGSEWPRFRNEAGQTLTSRYTLRHAPNGPQLFSRQTTTHRENLLILAPNSYLPHQEVLGQAIDLNYPTSRQNYNAGSIIADSTGKKLPIFQWLEWPGHPLTETDLRQFQNEQGNRLGDVVRFEQAPKQ